MSSSGDIQVKEYFNIVEEFLRDIQNRNVKCISMVALLQDDPESHDVFATYNCSPFDISDCASVMHLHAAIDYVEQKSMQMMEEGYEEQGWDFPPYPDYQNEEEENEDENV